MSMCTKISNSQKYKDTQCACVCRYPLCICTKIPTTHTDKPVRFIHLQKFNKCNISKIIEYLIHSADMFAWQDEVPIFEYVSIEDNAVAVQDLDAGFWESITIVPAYTIQ